MSKTRILFLGGRKQPSEVRSAYCTSALNRHRDHLETTQIAILARLTVSTRILYYIECYMREIIKFPTFSALYDRGSCPLSKSLPFVTPMTLHTVYNNFPSRIFLRSAPPPSCLQSYIIVVYLESGPVNLTV